MVGASAGVEQSTVISLRVADSALAYCCEIANVLKMPSDGGFDSTFPKR